MRRRRRRKKRRRRSFESSRSSSQLGYVFVTWIRRNVMGPFITFPFYMRIPRTWLVSKGKKWRGTSFSPDSEFLLSMVPTHAFPELCLLPSSLCAILLMFPSKTRLFFFAAVWQKTQISPPHFLTRFLTWHFRRHFPPSFSFHVKTLDVFGVANKDGSLLRTPGFKFLRQNQQQQHSWLHEGRGLERPHFTSFDMRIEFEIIHFFYFPLRCACGKSSPDCYSSHSVQKCPSITVSLSLDRPLWLWPFTQAQNPLKVALGGRRRRREGLFAAAGCRSRLSGRPRFALK